MRLLLVEDGPMIGRNIQAGLKHDGYTIDWVQDGLAAEAALANDVYELLLLDLGLPRKSGLNVLKFLKNIQISQDKRRFCLNVDRKLLDRQDFQTPPRDRIPFFQGLIRIAHR